MYVYRSDHFSMPLPPAHRFPFARYRLLREAVQARLDGQATWLDAPGLSRAEVAQAHCPDYVARVYGGSLGAGELRRLGFPWSPELVTRTAHTTGATVAAARAAAGGQTPIAVNLAGGTHHAFRDRGEGYCVFNDVAVAVHLLRAEGRLQSALVVDCDVHQGNGTAAFFAQDREVFTCSLHGQKNYPFKRERSDLDVELPDGTRDAAYLQALDRALYQIFACRQRWDLVFYLAGADPYEHDTLGRLALTRQGLAERDYRVLTRCRELDLPVVVLMAGGYAADIRDIAEIQATTVQVAAAVARDG